MIAALHLDNWLFILLIAVAMLFRWLTSVASKASKGSDETDERSTSTPPTAGPARSASPARTTPVESDEERIRKFLEALGQPFDESATGYPSADLSKAGGASACWTFWLSASAADDETARFTEGDNAV